MKYTNLEDFIKNGRNIELPSYPEIQIAPEGDGIILYALTPEETSFNVEDAEAYIRETTDYEPHVAEDSGGYEIGAHIPRAQIKTEWNDLPLDQFSDLQEIYFLARVAEDASRDYVVGK